jgi:hypothetical protein
MAVMPEPVHTRKLALAAEYGFDPMDIAEDGFTSEYVTVVGFPDEDTKADRYTVSHEADRLLPRVRYYWRPDDIPRAEAAILEDYREMIGERRFLEIQSLKASLP